MKKQSRYLTFFYPSPALRVTSPTRGEVILYQKHHPYGFNFVISERTISPLVGEVAALQRVRGSYAKFSLSKS